MEIVLLVLVVGLVVGLVWYLPRREPGRGPGGDDAPWGDAVAGAERVVLDLEVDDPDAPSVRRLVEPVIARIRATTPDPVEVVVVDRRGTELAVVGPAPALPPEPELPTELHEPRVRRSVTPDPTHPRGGVTEVRRETEPDDAALWATSTPFAHRLDLPAQVRERLAEDDHPAAVVAAVLQAAGRTVERHGELVRAGDVAIVVADVHADPERALSAAYLRLQRHHARHGLIIRLGYADPRAIARRERAAPHVRHADAGAIQRMADAVALGADPLAFAVTPAVVR